MKKILFLFSILLLLLFYIISNNYDFFDNTNTTITIDKYTEKYKIIEYNNLNITNNLNEHFLINKNFISYNPFFSNLKVINNIDNIDSFILILDFPYFGGGTTFFLNSILSKYLNIQNFVIVRNFENFNDSIKIYLNDLYIIDNDFTDKSALAFLNLNKHKITKIFINSIIDHSRFFIDNILLLNNDVTVITHDYSLLYTIYQPNNYNELLNNYTPISSNININSVKTIITQNINNLPLYDKYLDGGTEIIISPLPDYINRLSKIETNNKKIVVGIIGNISTIKGRDIIFELINNNLYDVYIFGGLEINYDKQFYYKNIEELNELLVKYRPNIWLEASMWAETYSYTLSLMMITELPILFLKKNFISVIVNRLSNYKKAVSFKNITHLIDYELIEIHKQDYFYTIDPSIYYNVFWDSYFGSSSKFNVNNKNIVLVTSKIVVSNKKFTYVNKRSIYSTEERYEQTINTIKSIRTHIPDTFIVLIDNSVLTGEMVDKFKSITDYFINVTDNRELNNHTDDSEYKAFGEIAQQLFFYNYFLSHINIDNIKHFFKISGRYFINDQFDYLKFDNEKSIFKKNINVVDREYYYTSFYKLNKEILGHYFSSLIKVMNNPDKFTDKHTDLEVIIPKLLKNKFITVDNIGITQLYSAWDKIDNI